jgi:tellurite resistance protein TehA-like permease
MQSNDVTNHVHDVRDGAIGMASGLSSALIHWLRPLGEVASHIGSIATCIIACIMLYRIVRGPKKDKQAENKDQPKESNE